jgi:FkbM family methyltransferase
MVKDWIRTKPALFDMFRELARKLPGRPDRTYDWLKEFSRRGTRFIQIGASDGLRNDPAREFIIRDHWQGALVEPLPTVFPLLEKNYLPYAKTHALRFKNVAVSAASGSLSFWTFKPEFLATLSLEDRLEYLRKASFNKAHVEHFLKPGHSSADALMETSVPVVGINELIRETFPDGKLDILVLDVEGHEVEIIDAIAPALAPRVIFFESHNLREAGRALLERLKVRGYKIVALGGDTAAVRM